MGNFLKAGLVGVGAGLIGKQFDKGPEKVDRSMIPHRIETQGIVAGMKSPGNIRVDLTPERVIAGRNLSQQYQNLSTAIGGVRKRVGQGEVMKAGLARYQAARERTMSNLRTNLAKRKILGSSFASNAMATAEAEFAQQEALFAAQQTQRDIQLETDLLVKEYTAAAQAYQQTISDLDLPTEVGLQLQQTLASTHAQLSQLDAELAARHRGGAANLGASVFRETLNYGLAQQGLAALGGAAGGPAGAAAASVVASGYQPTVSPVTPGRVTINPYSTAPAGPSLSAAPLWG